MTKTRVLVLDGEQRAALAVVRSLGKAGYFMEVGSSVRRPLAGGSRFASSESLLPSPLEGSEAYASAVAAMAARSRAGVVLPITEASTLAVLERRELFEGVIIPTSDLNHFRRAVDKAAVLELAGRLGLDVPAQWTVTSESLRSGGGIPHDSFPVVIKPSHSVVGPEGRRRKVSVLYASSQDELRRAAEQLGDDANPLLIQEQIVGPGLGVFLLRWEGRVVAAFAHRRIREKPPSGGVSVCCESVPAPEALIAHSESLLAGLDWTGVAMIEYKRDLATGRTCLMEVNPRFWGSLQLAVDAGVDFPRLLIDSALGRPIRPVRSWRAGLRSRWRLGEVDHLIARLRRSKKDLNLPENAPGVLETAAAALAPWWPNTRSEVFRISDPAPSLREAIAWVRAL